MISEMTSWDIVRANLNELYRYVRCPAKRTNCDTRREPSKCNSSEQFDGARPLATLLQADADFGRESQHEFYE